MTKPTASATAMEGIVRSYNISTPSGEVVPLVRITVEISPLSPSAITEHVQISLKDMMDGISAVCRGE